MEKFKVTGMSCAACSARVEKAVGSLAGVETCSVNLLTGDMSVSGTATRDEVIFAVTEAGYGIDSNVQQNEESKEDEGDRDTQALLIRLFTSLGLVIILMYFSMGHMIGLSSPFDHNAMANGLIQMLIAAVVMVINQRFFISGFKGLTHRAPNMDTLVSLGSLASFGYSFAMLIAMSYDIRGGSDGSLYLHELYFESAAMILALITLGKMLESRAKGKTTDALKALMNLKGKYATLLIDGEENVVSVDDVKVGDIFVIRPGESIPTDAVVISGSSAIDESMLTGESIPRDVLLGDNIYGGSINKSGFITARATKVGEGTVLSNIIEMVKEASSSKAPIAKLADKVSAVFVPSVMAISILTLVGWLIARESFGFAIARAISVLVISCPCALGLATPVAIMVSSGVGARRGVLYKTAAALEESGRVNTVVLDKTGTITLGEPEVCDVIPSDGFDDVELIALALSIEKKSEHPLARAIVKYAENKGIFAKEVSDFKSLTGRGVCGKIGEKEIKGLSFSAAIELCDNVPTSLADRLSKDGKTPIAFLLDGKYIGTIALRDNLKPDAKASVAYLKAMGIRVIMLSGDNERTACAIAKEVGIDEVIAGVLPDGKEATIREFRKSGKICMVGDGINDAPALTRADVGIAIGRGTDIAIDSADIVVMGKGTLEVAYAIGIGRATLRNIRQNLFWAFAYNCLGIPLAAGLFGLSLSPMIGAAMMSLSSFSVVTNALRLNLWKPKKITVNTIPCEENADNTEKNQVNNTENTEKKEMNVTIKVDGMMCPHCEARVKKACEAIDGVVSATPSHESGTVELVLTKDVIDVCRTAITDAGYDVID